MMMIVPHYLESFEKITMNDFEAENSINAVILSIVCVFHISPNIVKPCSGIQSTLIEV